MDIAEKILVVVVAGVILVPFLLFVLGFLITWITDIKNYFLGYPTDRSGPYLSGAGLTRHHCQGF